MSRLYRPHIPVEVKCRVVLRQLGEMFIDNVIDANRLIASNRMPPRGGLGKLLNEKLYELAALLACEVSDLRLDHDPPLALRPQERRGLGRKTYYVPDANDPEHLRYRPHGGQFEGSHDIKTRVRGDHGQYSDLALIRREKRRAAPRKRKASWQSKPMKAGKTKWPKRPFPKRRK